MGTHHALTLRCAAGRCRVADAGPAAAFLADESGKISIVSIPVFVFVGIMAAFLVNTGQSVREKISLQTAADAGAATTTLWMARSMNAVTATNHMLGEATAVLAIFDGFGGPMLYELRKPNGLKSEDSARLNKEIKNNENAAISGGGVISESLAPVDKKIVESVVKQVTRDLGRHVAGAALYDGKLTLKHLLARCLVSKQFANIGIQVGASVQKVPPVKLIGMGIEAAAVAAHLKLTAEIVAIAKEWFVLDALEDVVGGANDGGRITKPIAEIVIPGLSLHADTVVGRTASGQAGEPPMAQAIETSLRGLAAAHGVESLVVTPAPRDLRLPLVIEPPSPAADVKPAGKAEQARLGPWEQPRGRAWKAAPAESNEMQAIEQVLDKLRDPMNKVFDTLDPLISPLRKMSGELKKYLPSWIKRGFALMDLILDGRKLLPPADWKPEFNPCYAKETAKRLRVPAFHWRAETRSQWVRATHPYVDDLRAGVVGFLRQQAPRSQAATHYIHWTDRYTLVRSHQLRADRPADDPDKDPDADPLAALEAEIRKLRERFEDALKVDADTAPDEPADFEAIADELLAIVQKVTGSIETMQGWLDRVLAMPGEIGSAGDLAAASPPEDIDPEDARALAEQLTRIAQLDELLSLAESLADLLSVGPPHMYVIEGMNGTNKGDEPWTKDPQLAGRMFGVFVTAEQAPKPRLLDGSVFRTPTGRRQAWAGALLANGNGIRTGRQGSAKPDPARQVDTGWDTLNWQPAVEAWEWADHPPRASGPSPVQALLGMAEAGRKARVRLGWDGLLVPIEGFHLRELGPDRDDDTSNPFADFSDLLLH
jgi:hypothetical protein